MNEIMVSVICNTYNHEPYIKACLDGFIMQQTDFLFEVLVHDDASTDGTATIIREYESKYPQVIKPIYQTENQYSKNVAIGKIFQFPRVKGKYIAFCEGDDYWTDPFKLQKQFDAMEMHPEIDICAHGAEVIDAEDKAVIRKVTPCDATTVISAEDVIKGGGGFVVTNSLFYRKSLNDNVPSFREYIWLDYTLQIHGALRGGMLYLNDIMSRYRWMSNGSWTKRMRKDRNRNILFCDRMVKMFTFLNEDTENKYSDIITKEILQRKIDKLELQRNYREIFSSEYADVVNSYSTSRKIKLYIKRWMPWIMSIKDWVTCK